MGRREIARSAIFHLVSLQILSLGYIAWADASRGGDMGNNIGAVRQVASDTNRITVRGELKCTLATTNQGQACPLQLKTESGEILNIIGSDTAMKLYQAGKTQVVAIGQVEGDSLRITKIQEQ